MSVRTALAPARPSWFVGREFGPGLRLLSAALLAVTVIVIGVIVLTPGAPAPTGQRSLRDYLDLLHSQGRLPAFITFGLVEWLSNVVMFVPIGLLSAGAVRSVLRPWVVGAAFALSCAIELAQKEFLPDRVASLADVAANTTGALVGVLVLLMFAGIRRRD